MSNEAPNWFKEQYNDRVRHVYQAKGFMLRGTVMPEGTLEGTKAYFPVAGKGSARKKTRGQEAVPMNATRDRKEAVLETWEAFDEVYTYDLSRMGINEKEVIATTGAQALGRATDLEIMDKLDDSAAATGTANFLDGGANAFGLTYALQMCQMLQAQNVPWDGNVYCPLPSLFWNILLTYKQFSSSDYVGGDLPFTKSTVAKSWNNVHWFLAPDEYFPVPAANKFDFFMYHKSAAGWANNNTLSSIWQWDNRKGCWTVRMESEGAAVVTLESGIVRARFPSNSALSLN